jgi:hypothetical protein
MEVTTVFRKTAKGNAEIEERAFGLPLRLRRALIVVNGNRDLAELSVLMRPGELLDTIEQLVIAGFIEAVPVDELDPSRIAYFPAADDPVVFAEIKQRAINEIAYRLGPVAGLLIYEIDSCEDPLQLRLKLRNIENVLVNSLGQEAGEELARAIGRELTRLVPRED